MKKLLSIVLTLSLVLCLFGCGAEDEEKMEDSINSESTNEEYAEAESEEVTVDGESVKAEYLSEDIPDEVRYIYFRNCVINQYYYYDLDEESIYEYTVYGIASNDYYLEMAKKEGFVASEDITKEVNDEISYERQWADENGTDFEAYLQQNFGKAMTSEYLTKLLYRSYYVAEFIEYMESKIEITDEEIEDYYDENSYDISNVDIRLFGFDIDYFGRDEAVSLAQEMCDRITDEQSFVDLAYEYCAEQDKYTFMNDSATIAKAIKYGAVENNLGKDLADWLFSYDRSYGDKGIYTADNYVYVIYVLNTAYRIEDPLVDARHLLISFDEIANECDDTIDTAWDYSREVSSITASDGTKITNEGTGYSIELVEESYNRAYSIYEEYLSGKKTEDSFAELAEKYSDDTGSIGEHTLGGGLYEGIEKGVMVAPFEEWVYDEARKAGDVEIIMTEYGWHIMYFVRHHDEPFWKTEVRENLSEGKLELLLEEQEEEIADLIEEYTDKFPADEYVEKIDIILEGTAE